MSKKGTLTIGTAVPTPSTMLDAKRARLLLLGVNGTEIVRFDPPDEMTGTQNIFVMAVKVKWF